MTAYPRSEYYGHSCNIRIRMRKELDQLKQNHSAMRSEFMTVAVKLVVEEHSKKFRGWWGRMWL